MQKTMIPTLRFIAHRAYKYSTRRQDVLAQTLTPTQYTALANWIAATLALIQALGSPEVNP